MSASLLWYRCRIKEETFYHDYFCRDNMARSSLGGTNRQNAARAGVGYAGPNAPASAQVSVSVPPGANAAGRFHNPDARNLDRKSVV